MQNNPPNPNEPTYTPPYPMQQPPYSPMMTPPPQPPKKRRTWLWVVLGVLALIVFGCVGFSMLALHSAGTAINTVSTTVASTVTEGSTPAPASVVSRVGGTITLSDVATTLVSVKILAADQYTQPKPGNLFIVVHVKIVNNSTGEVDYNPFDFHARSGAGNITDEEFVVPSTYTDNNQLSSGKLSSGGKVEGDLIFQVPKGDHAAQLTWQPSFFGNAGDNAWNLGL